MQDKSDGSSLRKLNWIELLHFIRNIYISKGYEIEEIDADLVNEISDCLYRTLAGYDDLNPAKTAGHVCFWVRRLKPLHQESTSAKRMKALNEFIAIDLALLICIQRILIYNKTDLTSTKGIQFAKTTVEQILPYPIRKDLAISMRHYSHSPHGLAMIFEILFRDYINELRGRS
ncbi:MAG: hypothetical protein QM523_01410 [Candidatus Pacebacteria bacterium]|nr:hypothetical protein [Candidatus Paceibacterota bacterium]